MERSSGVAALTTIHYSCHAEVHFGAKAALETKKANANAFYSPRNPNQANNMRAVIQRVSEASVTVDDKTVGAIEEGFMVLLGVENGDSSTDTIYMADKTVGLRVFADGAGKMNLDVIQAGGKILVISQFTLLGDCRKGRRPAFTDAASPDVARKLYEQFCQRIRERGIEVKQGVFAADMQVKLTNQGPVTLMLDSRKQW